MTPIYDPDPGWAKVKKGKHRSVEAGRSLYIFSVRLHPIALHCIPRTKYERFTKLHRSMEAGGSEYLSRSDFMKI